MNILTLDCETTTFQNGNPFSRKNKLCYVGLLPSTGDYIDFKIEYDTDPYGDKLKQIQEIIDAHDVLVGFNIKFDLHWLSRYGINLHHKRFHCTQLVQFILNRQSTPYPSLNSCLGHYGLEQKLDEVALNYWNKGIDTPQVPEELLRDYLKQDVVQTKALYDKQTTIITPAIKNLISLANQDLATLYEMEENGMLYDTKTSLEKGDSLQVDLNEIDSNLAGLLDFPSFNPASGDHISSCLYGGTIGIPVRTPYIFTYKDGRTAEKQKWVTHETTFPRLVQPPKGSELKKEGYFAVGEEVLASLKAKGKARELIDSLLKRGSLEKLRGTYLHGLPKLIQTMDWVEDTLHGTLNQCVAITGRLSSTKPNLQNIDGNIGYLFKSRYV
jgi:DNA polymerase I-like protein with 3'-5' exonuclease and polymerase domains